MTSYIQTTIHSKIAKYSTSQTGKRRPAQTDSGLCSAEESPTGVQAASSEIMKWKSAEKSRL
jgi:hypothetical protein